MSEFAVFLDLGNTLLRSGAWSARRRLGQRLGLTEKEVKRAGRLLMTRPHETPETLAVDLSQVLSSREPGEVLDAVRTVWREQHDGVALHPDAMRLLASLEGRSCRLGLLSNVWPPVIQGLEASLPSFLKRFDHLIFSCRLGFKKPSAAIFEAALAMAGMPAHRCWMVGDSYELDMEPAMKAGMRALWVLSRPEAEKGLLAAVLRGDKPRPDAAVEELMELSLMLERLVPSRETWP